MMHALLVTENALIITGAKPPSPVIAVPGHDWGQALELRAGSQSLNEEGEGASKSTQKVHMKEGKGVRLDRKFGETG